MRPTPHPHSLSRRAFIAAAIGGPVCGWAGAAAAFAGEPAVPIDVQIGLLAKVAKYDRNMRARLGDAFVVLVLHAEAADSSRAATAARKHLDRLETVMGLPVRTAVTEFDDTESVVEQVERESPAVLLFASGLTDQVSTIAHALEGKDLLTMSLDVDAVGIGAILGFELVETRPRIVVDVAQAKRTNVEFGAQLLKLARVYR